MNALSQYLCSFLQEHLARDRQASRHTCDSYAYTFQLLVCFASRVLKKQPSSLSLEELDAPLILSFLNNLETERKNTPQTRNARLAAIKSFFRFLEYRLPSNLEQSRRIHAIPMKKTTETLVGYLTLKEVQAVLDAPDPNTREGIRDRAMLHLAFAAGLRVSELIGLRLDDLEMQPHPTIHVLGKGRKERMLPLWKETATALRSWLKIRQDYPGRQVFLNARGAPLTRYGFEYILAKYVKSAVDKEPSLAKKHVSPHVLRHSCAMHILQATHDIRRVALWLGHASTRSTEIYLRADPKEKMEALSAITPPTLRRGQFRPPDKLLALLHSR